MVGGYKLVLNIFGLYLAQGFGNWKESTAISDRCRHRSDSLESLQNRSDLISEQCLVKCTAESLCSEKTVGGIVCKLPQYFQPLLQLS